MRDLTGEYDVAGHKLHGHDVVLLISQRKKQTDKKPVSFLLVGIQGNEFEYISSLYQVDDGKYRFDTMKQMKQCELEKGSYILNMNLERAEIHKVGG